MAKILVVDDDLATVNLLTARLSASGHAVVTARDGVEATTVATREQPDLVILDYRLPAADGAKVHERLRRNAANAQLTPVIFLTGAPLDEVRMAIVEDAATRLLQKPADWNELDRAIAAFLGKPTPPSPPSPPAGHGGPHDDAAGPGSPEILDLDLEP